MFGLNRQVQKLVEVQGRPNSREGLTADDISRAEPLPLASLLEEAFNADAVAERSTGRRRSQLKLDSAVLWREVARRSGEVRALSRAATAAKEALEGHGWRSASGARARSEQGYIALLGAELFEDRGLLDVASKAFEDAVAGPSRGLAASISEIGLLAIKGRQTASTGDAQAARVAAARFAQPIAALRAMSGRIPAARILSIEGHILRADLLCKWGARLNDTPLLRAAIRDTVTAASGLTPDFEPLTIARIGFARAAAQIALGEVVEDAEICLAGVNLLEGLVSEITVEHSLLDRARIEFLLGRGHEALGDLSGDALSYQRALAYYEKVDEITAKREGLVLRDQAAVRRVLCLARSAELSQDASGLEHAEKALRSRITETPVARDPGSWALLHVNLSRLLLCRHWAAPDAHLLAGAHSAFASALDVLPEDSLRALGRAVSRTLDFVTSELQKADRVAAYEP